MPLAPYPLLCYTSGCGKPAGFKIAAQWSDGRTSELKTYGLVCDDCLPAWFRQACERCAACRLVAGETLGPPHIYRLERGQRDQQLQRLLDLEIRLGTAAESTH